MPRTFAIKRASIGMREMGGERQQWDNATIRKSNNKKGNNKLKEVTKPGLVIQLLQLLFLLDMSSVEDVVV